MINQITNHKAFTIFPTAKIKKIQKLSMKKNSREICRRSLKNIWDKVFLRNWNFDNAQSSVRWNFFSMAKYYITSFIVWSYRPRWISIDSLKCDTSPSTHMDSRSLCVLQSDILVFRFCLHSNFSSFHFLVTFFLWFWEAAKGSPLLVLVLSNML